jgi:hypothetical protein
MLIAVQNRLDVNVNSGEADLYERVGCRHQPSLSCVGAEVQIIRCPMLEPYPGLSANLGSEALQVRD